jgi:hypothetical protein
VTTEAGIVEGCAGAPNDAGTGVRGLRYSGPTVHPALSRANATTTKGLKSRGGKENSDSAARGGEDSYVRRAHKANEGRMRELAAEAARATQTRTTRLSRCTTSS